jgi:23S rRNA (adenine-N6)-dimethyltransferase
MGHPRESKSSLFINPFYTMEILFYFKREDFHPKPGVDVVLLHLKKKPAPDIMPFQRQAYRRFIETGLLDNGRKLKNILTPKQISKALRKAGFSDKFTPPHLLYVQWLCLFRCWADFYVKT